MSDDDFWANLDDALESPLPPARHLESGHRGHKRRAVDAQLPSEDEGDEPSSPSPAATSAAFTPASTNRPGVVNRNLLAAARQIGARRKLRTDQARELEDFAGATLSTQVIKIYAHLLSIDNQLNKLVSSAPPFEVSKDSELYVNLVPYGNSVFFSSKLAVYKGTVALNHLLDIVKQRRFGIPQGLEYNKASWNKVIAAAQNIFTQIRGSVKKEIKKSVKSNNRLQQTNIFDLTERILRGTGCKMTVPLMARIVLMRNVFLKEPGDDFWDAIDERLQILQRKCDTPEKLTRAFKLLLDKDRQEHGGEFDEPDIDEFVTDGVQLDVDEGITRAMIQRANGCADEEEQDGDGQASQSAGAGSSTPRPWPVTVSSESGNLASDV
ncbi:hypothetical protein FKP32DRAFT_1672328 [Trametes sanguinea]|nr:hypothetical protein FKP32DRAFT_1672328 [Trametes sanguinea]